MESCHLNAQLPPVTGLGQSNVAQMELQIEVRILRVDTADRKIGLSMRSDEEIREAAQAEAAGEAAGAAAAAKKAEDLKGGMGAGAGPLFSLGGDGAAEDGGDNSGAETE